MLRPLDPGEFVQGTIFTCDLSDFHPAVMPQLADKPDPAVTLQ